MNLIETIEKYGEDKIRILIKTYPIRKIFFLKYTSSTDTPIKILHTIDSFFNKIKDNYKITLVPVQDGFPRNTYYVSDLQQILRDGRATILVELELD